MKKTITTILLATILTFGTTFANAGIIVAGRSVDTKTDDPCTQSSITKDGIIVAGVGIIVAGFTGIIVAGFADGKDGQTNCGIIVAG